MRGVDVVIQVESVATPGTYVTVAGQRGAQLSESTNTIDITSKSSAGAKEFDYGLYEWKISLDGAFIIGNTEMHTLRDAMRNKTTVNVKWSENGSGATVEQGKALVISRDLDGAYDKEATYKITLQGTGKTTTTTNP